MTEEYSKQILKRSVAQICQVIGWNSIHSSPLQILTDIMQHYINGIARLSNKYTFLYGQTEPNLDHLALAFNEIGISISELQEYVKFIDSSSVADVPVYPLPRESHLNMLKPGCWENVTRPVHIHEHLPPMHPESETNSTNGSSGTFVSPNVSGSIDDSPEASPKPAVFKRPGDPVSDIVAKRSRPMMDDEIRPLREISSVMMTTSGFLSPAREGKLPEARTIPIPVELESENDKKPDIQSLALPPKDQSPTEVKPEKKKKSKSEAKKTDKENKAKDDSFSPSKDDEPKVKKLATSGKESSKLKALKSGAVKVLAGSSKSEKKKNKLLASNTQTMKLNKSKSPKAEKRPFPPNYDSEIFEEKLTSEPDKQKLNIFKKISKVKEEHDDKMDLDSMHDAKRISMDATIEAVIQKSRTSSDSLRDHDSANEENYQSMYPFAHAGSESPLPSMTSGIPKTPDIPKISEPKKKKKDKHKDKDKNDKEKYSSSPKSSKYYEDISKPKTPDVDMNADDSLPSSFPFYNYPPGPGLLPFSHPLIPNNPLVGGLYAKIPPTPPFVNTLSKQDLPSLPPSLTITPINPYPSPSISGSTPASVTITPSRLMSSPSMTNTPASSASSDANKSALDSSIASNNSSKVFSSASASPSPNKMKKEKNRLGDSEKEKKQKNKLKKKKNKKEKIKSKDKSERKKLKLEKKEKNKEKSKLKKEKKEKKKDKKEKKEKKKDKQHKDEKGDAVGLVPKITVKLNHPGSSQTPPPEPTHRKIVIKPVVKKDEPDLSPERSLLRLKPTKLSKHSTSYAEDDLKMVTSSQVNTLPPSTYVADVKPENEANKVWICPACCGPDDGSPMIACDSCDMWYHWTCVGIQVAPESDWYCQKCLIKNEELMEKKKKHKKKKF